MDKYVYIDSDNPVGWCTPECADDCEACEEKALRDAEKAFARMGYEVVWMPLCRQDTEMMLARQRGHEVYSYEQACDAEDIDGIW